MDHKYKRAAFTSIYYYSLILSVLILGIAFLSAKDFQDYLNAILFLPIVLYIVIGIKNFYPFK